MDHIPWPEISASCSLEVIYLCDSEPEYDGLGFCDYPIRRGWSSFNEKFQWLDCSPILASIRAQNWLFFGLLREFLGDRFRKDDYWRRGARSSYLDTTVLPLRLSDLERSMRKLRTSTRDDWLQYERTRQRWNDAFLEAKVQNEMLNITLGRKGEKGNLLIALSSTILLHSLQRTVDKIFWQDDIVPIMNSVSISPAWFSVWQKFDAGWCNFQAGYIHRGYPPFLNHYTTGLSRQHGVGDHDRCNWDICVGNNVDEQSYQTKHVRERCTCQFVGPNSNVIKEIIRKDQIPLIKMSFMNGNLQLDVITANPSIEYFTISHVWSGGLGNFTQNTLPLCQLHRLYELLIALYNHRPQEPRTMLFGEGLLHAIEGSLYTLAHVLHQVVSSPSPAVSLLQSLNPFAEAKRRQRSVIFWMDTLCIPVGPAEKDLRGKAINSMALTYAAAQRCLVLDPELQRISTKGMSTVQMNAHVLCSPWLGRSWTYQEARLSRTWYAQFADGLYNPNSVENAALNHLLYIDWHLAKDDAHELASESIMWYHNMPSMRKTDIYTNQSDQLLNTPLLSFINLWNHMASRSTSKPEDIHSILANMTNLNASEVMVLPYEERMKAILRAQKALPAALLFTLAPKIQDRSNRWVPQYPQGLISELYGQLRPSQGGFLLDDSKTPVGYIVDSSVPRYSKLRLVDAIGLDDIWATFFPDQEKHCDQAPIDTTAPGELIAVCYIMGDLAESLSIKPMGRPFSGARFGLRKKDHSTLHLVYECTFRYYHYCPDSRVADQYPLVVATKTDPGTAFLIECGKFTSAFSLIAGCLI